MPYAVLLIVLIAIDQISKSWAIHNLKGQEDIILIKDWLHLTYVENSGAAWGIFQNGTIFFVLVTFIVIFGISFYLLKESNNVDTFTRLSLVIIIAGAIGNLIDRLRLGYVVDFIFTPLGGLYNFPVFNFADIYISLGAIILAIYIIFFEGKNAK